MPSFSMFILAAVDELGRKPIAKVDLNKQ